MIRTIAIASSLAVGLAGCVLTKKPGEFIVPKLSSSQLEANARKMICGSFETIRFSKSGDTPATVKAIREHNAALASYKCPKR